MTHKKSFICLLTLLLILPLCLCACKKDTQGTESGTPALQIYRLPTEWTVTRFGKAVQYDVSYDGNTATVTKDGELVLRFTLDGSGNVVHREDADGSVLTAVCDGDGRLTETLLRSRKGELQRRTVYDEHGRAIREHSLRRYDAFSLREYTYGDSGELLTETQYSNFKSYAYEYHEDGSLAAETKLWMDAFPYERREYDGNGVLTQQYKYDEDGNVSRRYTYNAEGELTAEYDADGNLSVEHRREEAYDENGNLTEYFYYASDGSLYARYEYDYDERGNQTARRTYSGEGVLSGETRMTYDENGVLTTTVETLYDQLTGEFFYHSTFEWDAYGNDTKVTVRDEEGTVTTVVEREYERIGGDWYMTFERTYAGEGTLQSRQETTYDENGNLLTNLLYTVNDTLYSRTENTYNEQGKVTDHTRYFEVDGDVFYREVSVYNLQGDLQEYTHYNADGSLFSHTVYENSYEYDGEGRVTSAKRAAVSNRLTYAYESGSALTKVTCRDEDGNVVYTKETVRDNNGNPRIEQLTEEGYELRYDYEWSPEGGLLTFVRSDTGSDGVKTEIARLEAGGHVECTLTEVQYRQLLTLLLEATGAAYTPIYTITD